MTPPNAVSAAPRPPCRPIVRRRRRHLVLDERWTIVGLLSASITINLLDRQVLSVLASELRAAVPMEQRAVPATSPSRSTSA